MNNDMTLNALHVASNNKFLIIHCPPKVWKHWQSVVLDDISINHIIFLVQIH